MPVPAEELFVGMVWDAEAQKYIDELYKSDSRLDPALVLVMRLAFYNGLAAAMQYAYAREKELDAAKS